MRSPPTRPEAGRLITTYPELVPFVNAFAAGEINLLILVGGPGLQKSRIMRDAVGPDVCWIAGEASAFGLYRKLWEYRDCPVVLDDVDDLCADRAALRLLKNLCQTEPRVTVAWQKATRELDRVGVPRSFTTSSRVLIITNAWRTLNAHVGALEDRGHVLHFAPSPLEVHRRVATWFWDQPIFDFVGAHLHLVCNPSMRHYMAAWELKRAGLDWMTDLLGRWLQGKDLVVARLKADPSYATEEDRVRAFVESGHGCRATFFNRAKRLRPTAAAPRILLQNTRPPECPQPQPDILDILRRRSGQLGGSNWGEDSRN
jgi:hypothetical protein